ncbi:saccharopine dehydrogenase NADP-binding domain-containing protein [Emcibacteraceae bacterium]|nr:saccharopine dehydrogenase NADP-binding domain-containing protein [Emcibacteraceae bacterium]
MPSNKPAIHWLGAGLASGPGLISLVNKWGEANVWSSEINRPRKLLSKVNEGATLNVHSLALEDNNSVEIFRNALRSGDIIISMLPATLHIQVANIAIDENCHLVTSSYINEEMRNLNGVASAKGLSLVNEVGLDPGIDHLLTHVLIDEARKANVLDQGNKLDFVSYCGGFPVEETPFTYKFSWTPLGVLSALTNPAQFIKNGKETETPTAWEAVSEFSIHNEVFEAYANRNSLPFIAEYGLDSESNLRTFVRGTLRKAGWKHAWKDIFSALVNISSDDLGLLSDKLWKEHQYNKGEQDRVLLYVALTSTSVSGETWKGSLTLDEKGNGWQSAMASTVSYTVAQAVNALMEGRLSPGVQAAPDDVVEAKLWLRGLAGNGIKIKTVNVDL